MINYKKNNCQTGTLVRTYKSIAPHFHISWFWNSISKVTCEGLGLQSRGRVDREGGTYGVKRMSLPSNYISSIYLSINISIFLSIYLYIQVHDHALQFGHMLLRLWTIEQPTDQGPLFLELSSKTNWGNS